MLLTGFYCCGRCTVSLWRHLNVGGLENGDNRLEAGMKVLKYYRDGNGKWKRFPFYYTLLALSEIKNPLAMKEIQYVSEICERYLKRKSFNNKINQRRKDLMKIVLDKL